MKIGYMRVSTFDQNLFLQEDALKKEGCEKIFSDKISGSLSKDFRPGLKEAMEFLREGDVLVVFKLDRLGRSLKNLIELVNEMGARKIGFKSLSENIDTSIAGGKLIFHIFGAVAEFERDLIRDRTKAGLAAARARGRAGGRPKKLTDEKIRMAKQLHADANNKVSDILNVLNVGKSSFYKMLSNKS